MTESPSNAKRWFNPELTTRLVERFPLALADALEAEPESPFGAYGIECGAGWEPVLTELLVQLESEIAAQPEAARVELRVSQIKQKFGMLRVYLRSQRTEAMEQAIEAAVGVAARTCEVCSAPARLDGWACLCERHRARAR